jgi:hypothetical protein
VIHGWLTCAMPKKPTESAAARKKTHIIAIALLGIPDGQMCTVRTMAIREVSSEVTDTGEVGVTSQENNTPHLMSL